MKRLLPAVAIVAFLILPQAAQAQADRTSPDFDKFEGRVLNEFEGRFLNEMVSESLDCVAYYSLAAAALEAALSGRGEQFRVPKKEQIRVGLLAQALVYAESINLKSEAFQIRLKWATENQMELIDKSFVNMSILIDKYAEPCQQIYQAEPESRMRYWADRLFPDRR